MSQKKTQENRQKTYGSYKDRCDLSEAIKDVYKKSPNWDKLKPYQKDALCMTAVKHARLLNGDPDHFDSWHDVAGYHIQVQAELEKEDDGRDLSLMLKRFAES